MQSTRNAGNEVFVTAKVIGLNRIVGFVKEIPYEGRLTDVTRKLLLNQHGGEAVRAIDGKPGMVRIVKSGHDIVEIEIDGVQHSVWIEGPIKGTLGIIDAETRDAIKATVPATIDACLKVGRKGRSYYKVDDDHMADWLDRAIATNPTLQRRRNRTKCWREIHNLFESAKDSLAARKGLRLIVEKFGVEGHDATFIGDIWTFTGKVNNLSVKVNFARDATSANGETA